MPIQKIKSGRILTVDATTYVGEGGTIFYDEHSGELRLSDGKTPGGILVTAGGNTSTNYILPIATTFSLGGIIIGTNLTISNNGVLSVSPVGNIDGGLPNSIFGGITSIDGGGI